MTDAYTKVEKMAEDTMEDIVSEEMKLELQEALTLKSEKVEAIFKQRQDKKDAEQKKFELIIASEKKQIRTSIEKMDMEVQQLTILSKPKFIYKKLDLFGEKPSKHAKYFESISEEKFNSMNDKNLLKLESLKVQLSQDQRNLSLVETKLSNGDLFEQSEEHLDFKSFTFDLESFKVDKIQM